MDVPARHRPLVLLVAVTLAQVLLLAFQVKQTRGERHVLLIRVWSIELLTPLQRAGTYGISKIAGVWYGYIDLRHAHTENQQLTQEVEQLRLKNQELEGRSAEAERLSRLLGFRQANASIAMVAAEVIGAGADSTSETIFINRGAREGIRKNMAVITPDGAVGKIFEALSSTSQVLLISDKESGVGALLANTRTHGVVKGTGDPLLWMDYVTSDEKVPDGEKVLTSGEDRIFPKDIPVGTVVSTKSGLPFQTIEVQPAAHLDRLEEVLVLLTQQPLTTRPSEAAGAPVTGSGANALTPPIISKSSTPVAPSDAAPAHNSKETKSAAPVKKPTGTNPPQEQQ
ncbi:MAG TPA: rod shape-determining protein MreC [Candidatus Acidoferrales bacterium]|nr:rod shape-determining protein MreC [Candidatus Acidoferrales bacterium]